MDRSRKTWHKYSSPKPVSENLLSANICQKRKVMYERSNEMEADHSGHTGKHQVSYLIYMGVTRF